MQDDYISINTESEEELEQLVKRLDPDLKFIRHLHPNAQNCRTLLVEHQGKERALKIRSLSGSVWEDTYFYREIHALMRVEERKLSGVTHMVNEYQDDHYQAILKEYATGTPMSRLDHESLLKDEDFIKKLDELYLKLHLAGIAKIHFQPRKIVIDENDELHLVDLSTCVVNTECGMQIFSQEMNEDSQFINRLERAAQKARKQQQKNAAA